MKKTLLGLMISRRLINQKVEIFKKYLKDGRPNSVYENLQTVTWNLTKAISSLKRVYYERIANKLNDSNTSSKVYWSTIKTLANGKKVPVIPRILVLKKLVTDFDDFFSKQCQPIPKNSTLPSIQIVETSNRLSTVDIDSKKMLKLMQGLNSNKAHEHDGISITMLNFVDSH